MSGERNSGAGCFRSSRASRRTRGRRTPAGRRRRLLRVVDDLLDDPAQRLRQAVEVAVEGAQPRQLDRLLHELVFVALLGARLLPLTVELLRAEALVDAGEAEGPAHRLLALALQLL